MSLPDLTTGTGTAPGGRTSTGPWSSTPGQGEDVAVLPQPYRPTPSAGVREPGSRPSPRPRPVEPVQLVRDDVVVGGTEPGQHGETSENITERNSPPVSTGESESAPGAASDQENGPEVSSLQSSLHFDSDTLRERIRVVLAGLREYVTPPSVLTDPPPSIAELRAYARWGTWTSSTGGLRRFGIAWHRLVSVPVTTICRYTEWIWQRPGRLIPIYLIWQLLISTGPGPWAADHLIRPVLGFVAWVLL